MFCSECGQKNADDAKFCMKCGKELVIEKTVPPSTDSMEKPVTGVSQDVGQAHLSPSVDSKIHGSAELKDSGTVTAISVIGLVFGLIGMLGSFIPCIGSLAFYVGIPAAIASTIAVGIAYSQHAKRTFAIVALTISLIGVVISGWQYFAIISTGEKARKELQKMSHRSAPIPMLAPAPTPAPARKLEPPPPPAPAPTPAPPPAPEKIQSINITDAFMTSALNINKKPIDRINRFPLGQRRLYYYAYYNGAIPGKTRFEVSWAKRGIIIGTSDLVANHADGYVYFHLDYNFQPDEYQVTLKSSPPPVNINTTRFHVVEDKNKSSISIERPDLFHSGDTLEGYYICQQGKTNLILKIKEVSGNKIIATFNFMHPPSGARGVFFLNGTYDRTRRHISFTPGEWIENPYGYTSVGMKGEMKDNPVRYEGNITHPGCSSFSVKLAVK